MTVKIFSIIFLKSNKNINVLSKIEIYSISKYNKFLFIFPNLCDVYLIPGFYKNQSNNMNKKIFLKVKII